MTRLRSAGKFSGTPFFIEIIAFLPQLRAHYFDSTKAETTSLNSTEAIKAHGNMPTLRPTKRASGQSRLVKNRGHPSFA
jgi:hypothetical protein